MKILNLAYPDKSDIKYRIDRFPDGQQQVKILSNIRELLPRMYLSNFVDIQIKSRLNNFKDLELIICAVKSLKGLEQIGLTFKIHLYTPYFLGSRSDRKFEEGSNNYLKDVICPLINSLNFKTVTVIDPHSDCLEMGIKGFKKESNLELVKFALYDLYPCTWNISQDNFILVSPDAGANKKIYKLAEQIGYKGDIITCSKDRDSDGKLTKTVVPEKVENADKDFIILDDICDGGQTFINIAKEIKSKLKDNKIYLIVTHSIFSKGTNELLKYFDGIFTTNSYKEHDVEKIKVLNIF